MSVGGTGKEGDGDGEPTRTRPRSPSLLNSGPNVRAAKKAIIQEKKDKTEDAGRFEAKVWSKIFLLGSPLSVIPFLNFDD